mgnify:CR=1 FL=1
MQERELEEMLGRKERRKTWWLTALAAVLLMAVLVPSVSALDPESGNRGLNKQLTVSEAVGLIKEKFGLDDLSPGEGADPDEKITREQFAHLVQQAIDSKGDFAYIMIYILVADEADINPAYMGSIQKMLISGLMSLDKNGKFHPDRPVYRYYALDVIDRALKFVGEAGELSAGEPKEPEELEPVRVEVEKVTDEVNRVKIFRTVPHPGYGLEINRIEFTPDGIAVIRYSVTEPDPDLLYPQVITEAEAETFIPSRYTPEAKPAR